MFTLPGDAEQAFRVTMDDGLATDAGTDEGRGPAMRSEPPSRSPEVLPA